MTTVTMNGGEYIELDYAGGDDSFGTSPFRSRANTWPVAPRADPFGDVDGPQGPTFVGTLLSIADGSSDQLTTLTALGDSGVGLSDAVIPTPATEASAGLAAQIKLEAHHYQQNGGTHSNGVSPVLNGNGLIGSLLENGGSPVGSMDPITLGDVGGGAGGAGQKKNTSRRNAWGNMSYADLITQAIQSSPERRLTLSQIYDWMVSNVPYFKDKGDSNSSAGWKNSIRHNLSLHNRFMRVQNEGTGKSSWWMINPDAKPGKAARRRATSMETQKYEKKRGRVKKKVEALRASGGVVHELVNNTSPASSVSEGPDTFPTLDNFPNVDTFPGPVTPLQDQRHNSLAGTPNGGLHGSNGYITLSPMGDFRPRASSNASSCSRMSPIQQLDQDMVDQGPQPLLGSSVVVSGICTPTTNGTHSSHPVYSDQLVSLTSTMSLSQPQPPQAPTAQHQHQQQAPQLSHQQHLQQQQPHNQQQSMALFDRCFQQLANPPLDLENFDSTYDCFDCDIDQVISHELSVEGRLDFD